jgi:hypothetical protein
MDTNPLCAFCDEPAIETVIVRAPKRIPDWTGTSTTNLCRLHLAGRKAQAEQMTRDLSRVEFKPIK